MPELVLTPELRKLRRFDRDLAWFQSHYDDLKKKYKGEYVAVKDRMVIDHDENLTALFDRLKEKREDISSLVVEFISEEKVEYIL